jgi:hypothetical protein
LIKVEIEGDPVVTGLSWRIDEDVRQDIMNSDEYRRRR